MRPLSKHLQSPLCSPAAWSCPSAAGPPADASPRWKCWVSAAAACSGCCRTSPLCSGCRTEAGEGQKRAISNDTRHRFPSCVTTVYCEWLCYAPGRTASRRELLLSTTSLLSYHTAACAEPQELNTAEKETGSVKALTNTEPTQTFQIPEGASLPPACRRKLTWCRWARCSPCTGRSL